MLIRAAIIVVSVVSVACWSALVVAACACSAYYTASELWAPATLCIALLLYFFERLASSLDYLGDAISSKQGKQDDKNP